MKIKKEIQTIILFASISGLILGSGGFLIGMKYGETKKKNFGNFEDMAGGQFGGMRNSSSTSSGAKQNQNRAGGISGEITSKDNQSITLKLLDGGSKIIFFGNNVSIFKQTSGSIDDVKVGGQISVMGKTNQDGSVSADSIQIRPEITKK